ncbi:MAG TPA: preprotein translocase subunit YajC [Candidatus Acidoferrum sp.]|nr:preprotein translocase subunit YajC [Candidatus Acidoferrum sp.]
MGHNVVFSLLQTSPSNPLVGFLPILLIFGIFYFLLFRPMQTQRKRTQEMLASLENGQTVVTSGGIIGTVVSIDGDNLILRVKPDNIKLQVARSAVSGLVSTEVKK